MKEISYYNGRYQLLFMKDISYYNGRYQLL